ncbi:hypothetical protein [Serratia fonticola]
MADKYDFRIPLFRTLSLDPAAFLQAKEFIGESQVRYELFTAEYTLPDSEEGGDKTQTPTEKTRAIIEKMTAYISMFE